MTDNRERMRQAVAEEQDRRRRRLATLVTDAKAALTELDDAEQRSLRGLLPRTFKEAIPQEHEEKFRRLGLVERKLGGLVLTMKGEMAGKQVSPW